MVLVQRAPDASSSLVQDMGINHRRTDIAVAQELLYGPDIVSSLQQVSAKGVSQGMATRRFGDASPPNRLFDRPLKYRFMEVTPSTAGHAITMEARRREDPLPIPLIVG